MIHTCYGAYIICDDMLGAVFSCFRYHARCFMSLGTHSKRKKIGIDFISIYDFSIHGRHSPKK